MDGNGIRCDKGHCGKGLFNEITIATNDHGVPIAYVNSGEF